MIPQSAIPFIAAGGVVLVGVNLVAATEYLEVLHVPEETVAAVMPAGSAVLYLGKTMHAAGANVSADQWRRGLHMSFCLGWLTPEEASPIGVPWETARTYPPRVQRLLGYASPARQAGWSPANWLVDFEDVRNHLGVPYDRPA